jgi:hypothetical protein
MNAADQIALTRAALSAAMKRYRSARGPIAISKAHREIERLKALLATGYTLDGAAVDPEEFISDNELAGQAAADIRAMTPGESRAFGGGAAPIFVLRREATAG